MALYNNGYRLGNTPFKRGLGALGSIYNGGGSCFSDRMPSGIQRASSGLFGEYAGRPIGALHPSSWMLPQKPGALSSHNEAQGSSTTTLSLASGRNIAASADGASTTQATLQLVVSLAGTSAGSAAVSGNVAASLTAAGSTAAVSTAAATISALAWAYGTTEGGCAASLTPYATGRLYGSISPFTELSPENLAASVWESLAASFNDAGTMGNKLNTASSGGVDLGALADAVLAAAAATPIASNIKQVNDITVTGDGQTGTEWGPA